MSGHTDHPTAPGLRRGFSLVELVVVVTIIGILASIAVPRMSAASANARGNALQATLANVRKAIDIYYAEHGRYPGYNPVTKLSDDTAFVNQLTWHTDDEGDPKDTPSATHKYGPYLRSPFPRNPFNDLATVKVKAGPGDADPAADTFGWVAVLSHGYFGISAADSELEAINMGPIDLKAIARGGASLAE